MASRSGLAGGHVFVLGEFACLLDAVQPVAGAGPSKLDRSLRTISSRPRLELQADCLAGGWGFQAAGPDATLSDGSGEHPPSRKRVISSRELAAAGAVGDDRIQETATGSSNPHTFTHGTAQPRIGSFIVGFETGETCRAATRSASSTASSERARLRRLRTWTPICWTTRPYGPQPEPQHLVITRARRRIGPSAAGDEPYASGLHPPRFVGFPL